MRQVCIKMENIGYDNIFNYMKENNLTYWHSSQTNWIITVSRNLELKFAKLYTQIDSYLTINNYAQIPYLTDDILNELEIFIDEVNSILLADKMLNSLSVSSVKRKVKI